MKLFVWDFHGTLEKDNEFAVKEICETTTDGKISIEKVRELYGKPWSDYFKAIDPTLSSKKLDELIENTRVVGIDIYKKHTKAADNAVSVLETVKKNGDVNVVLSNTRDDIINGFLEHVKILHLVDESVGISREREVNGHDTAEYKAGQIIRLMSGKEYDQVIVIGDSEADIIAGKSAGAVTFMIDRWNRHPETSADYRIKDLSEVLRVYQ